MNFMDYGIQQTTGGEHTRAMASLDGRGRGEGFTIDDFATLDAPSWVPQARVVSVSVGADAVQFQSRTLREFAFA